MEVTNHVIKTLVSNGILGIKTLEVPSNVAYNTFTFKKDIKTAFDAITEKEQELLKEAKLSFEDIDEQGTFKESTDKNKLKKFSELRESLYLDKSVFKFENYISYHDFHSLMKENEFLVNLELLLENILWKEIS